MSSSFVIHVNMLTAMRIVHKVVQCWNYRQRWTCLVTSLATSDTDVDIRVIQLSNPKTLSLQVDDMMQFYHAVCKIFFLHPEDYSCENCRSYKLETGSIEDFLKSIVTVNGQSVHDVKAISENHFLPENNVLVAQEFVNIPDCLKVSSYQMEHYGTVLVMNEGRQCRLTTQIPLVGTACVLAAVIVTRPSETISLPDWPGVAFPCNQLLFVQTRIQSDFKYPDGSVFCVGASPDLFQWSVVVDSENRILVLEHGTARHLLLLEFSKFFAENFAADNNKKTRDLVNLTFFLLQIVKLVQI
jgi:hypothetical protein